MQTLNGDQINRSIDSAWYLLAEYSLSEIFVDNGKGDKFKAGFLSQTFRELGVPPEWIGYIEMTLTGFAKEALGPIRQGRLEPSGSIRIFCQEKVIVEVNSAKTPRPLFSEQTGEYLPINYYSGTILNRGWGYFIIDRSGGEAGSNQRSSPLVDLYLYQEGE